MLSQTSETTGLKSEFPGAELSTTSPPDLHGTSVLTLEDSEDLYGPKPTQDNSSKPQTQDEADEDSMIYPCKSNHLLYIPGWVVLPKGIRLLTLLLANSVGYFFFSFVLVSNGGVFGVLSKLTIFIVILVYNTAAIGDPGFHRGQPVSKKEYSARFQEYTCHQCLNRGIPKSHIRHCWNCNICVRSCVHHDTMFANCITSKNLKLFLWAKLLCCFGGIILVIHLVWRFLR